MNEIIGKKIITYCNRWYRGNMAADELNNQEIDAINMEEGYNIWKYSKNKSNYDIFY
jgi:rhodanese-related sulfurtransferase